MKKEELTAIGISEELAVKVLEQHTAELTAEQQKNSDLASDLETAKTNITQLTDKVKGFDGVDIEGLKKSAEDWEAKYNSDTAALKVDKALELALVGAKAKDVSIVKSQIDTGLLKIDENGKVIGLSEQLEKLQTDKAFLFDSNDDTTEETARIDTALPHGNPTSPTSIDQARAVMGLPVENGGK